MHTVYRLYVADDTLVYVGITNNAKKRISEHRRDKTFAYAKTYELPSRFLTEVAEALVISLFEPHYNKRRCYGGTEDIADLVCGAVRLLGEDRAAFEESWAAIMRQP